jgi:hypothetical protein
MTTRPALLAAVVVAVLGTLAGCGSGEPSSGAATESDGELSGDEVRVAATGDFGTDPEGVATLRAMAGTEPDVYLGLGDLSYLPNAEEEFCDLVHSITGPDARFEIVSGNHEDDSGDAGRIGRFAKCLPDRAGAVGDYAAQYYFDVGSVARFIMIAPDLTVDGDKYDYGPDGGGGETPELRWLRESVEGAREEGIDWVVVGMHKNCISTGAYPCEVSQDLSSALIEEGVDVVLSGHDHTYQRSKQITESRPGCPEVVVGEFNPDCVVDDDDSYAKGKGTVFVIAGAGGVELYPVSADDPEAGYFVTTMGENTPGNRHGFADLTITPERLGLEFVGSAPGTFSDSFEIVGDGS